MNDRSLPPDDRLGAFCQDSRAYLQGEDRGPLAGLTFAAKDIFDVKGHVTGGGNPDWKASQPVAETTAWAVEALVGAGAAMVGKTHTDELTRGILGVNAHYGTPLNPRAPGRVPGGSSSGSAAAVAGGLVDFALGSDTGGSVRIPASFCGLYGLRPSHGRIPLHGILLQAPSYDTVGWFARDPDLFARVGSVLLQTEIGPARPRRLVVAADAFEVADESVRAALEPLVERLASLIGVSSRERLAPTSLSDWAAGQRVRASSESLGGGQGLDRPHEPQVELSGGGELPGRQRSDPSGGGRCPGGSGKSDRPHEDPACRGYGGLSAHRAHTGPAPGANHVRAAAPVLTHCPVDLHRRNHRGASNQPALGRGGGTPGGAFPDGGSGIGRDADRLRPRSRRNPSDLIESSGKHASGRLQSPGSAGVPPAHGLAPRRLSPPLRSTSPQIGRKTITLQLAA